MRRLLVFTLLCLPGPAQNFDHFERRVRPLLSAKCFSCHGAKLSFGSLRLDSREAILKGGSSGPAAIPGDTAQSLLLKAVRHEGLKMPQGGKLAQPEIESLEAWVRDGLPWPQESTSAATGTQKPHWAFQPVPRITLPPGSSPNPIDRFLPSAKNPSDRRLLARRASFVLTGLPPQPEALQKFLNDTSAGAYANYVDALLANPHYGERWARHWMDVARYAETYGYEWNFEITGAWQYRDYLIRAFNSDLPYPQFIREQIAGDLIKNPRIVDGRNESALGVAFLRLGEMGHDNCFQFRELRTDVVDNQIDTLTKAFQGLTVSCARCHDHKIDPIPTSDYYGLYGVLNSSRQVNQTLEATRPDTSKLDKAKGAIRAEFAARWLADAKAIAAGLTAKSGHWQKLLEREKLDLSDPLYPFAATEPWPEVLAKYEKETAERAAYNKANFVEIASFQNGIPHGWSVDGLGARQGQAADGDFFVAMTGSDAFQGFLPAGLHTHRYSPVWNGTLRSPILPKDKAFISVQMMGGGLAAQRIVVDHCVIGEDHEIVDKPRIGWVKVRTKNKENLPVYLELNTKSDNPRLPERPGKFKNVTDESLNVPASYFGVTRVVLHDVDATPKPELTHMARLTDRDPRVFQKAIEDAIAAWRDGKSTADDVTWLNWAIDNGILSNQPTDSILAYRELAAKLPSPTVAAGMADLDPGVDNPIFIGGGALRPGTKAPRHFLTLLPEAIRPNPKQGSGRAEVAEAIASPENPLTYRVMVNRIWHYVFGRGFVPSTDNFGRLSDPPANPELLDYLATAFTRHGSTKQLLRQILLSQAFQADYPVRRLEAEAIRDSILAAAGNLDPTLYGPSIQPSRIEPTSHRRLFQGPLDGNGRRSIYTKVTRMEGPRFLETFDFPAPLQTRGNRDVTNVPSQALALMNDPFVINQSRLWAQHLVQIRDDSIDARLNRMFEETLTRPPTESERQRFRGLIDTLNAGSPSPLQNTDVWQHVAHTLFSTKEFLYLR